MKRWAVIDWREKEIYIYDTEKEAEAHILREGKFGYSCDVIDLHRLDKELYYERSI